MTPSSRRSWSPSIAGRPPAATVPSVRWPKHAPALAERGVAGRLVVLYRPPPGAPEEHPFLAEMRQIGWPAEQIVDRAPFAVSTARRLALRIRSGPADVLHTHDYKTNILGGIAARRMDGPLPWVATVHLHTTTTARLRLYRALDLFLLRLADRVITVSLEQQDLLVRRGIEPARVVVVPNVIDADAYAAMAEPSAVTRAELGLDPSSRVVTFLGRLSPQKGVDTLLAAAVRLCADDEELRILVVGDGPQRRSYERLAERLGLDGAVRFLGYRSDTASILAASSAVVLPSRAEGLPLALLEAAALARPIVASDVGGVPDMALLDGQSALLAPPDAPDMLAAKLRLVLTEPALAAGLGERARQVVLRQHSPSWLHGAWRWCIERC